MQTIAFLFLAFLLCAPAPARAQAVTIEPGEAYRVQWTHDGLRDPVFALVIDQSVAQTYAASDLSISAPDSDGLRTYTAPGVPLAAGTHTLIVRASNAAGAADSAPASVPSEWTSPPAAPGGVTVIRITIEVRSGGRR